MSNVRITKFSPSLSLEERIIQNKKLINKFKEKVLNDMSDQFKTSEEKNTAKIALEVSSKLLFEYLKNESQYSDK
jgi:hypothetical protein